MDDLQKTERDLAEAAWSDAEAAFQKASPFNVASCYQRVLDARTRAMAAGIDVLAQLRG